MVKTTINLEDELYRKLVKEAVERYGKTRSFSKLINEKLKESLKTKKKSADVKRRLKIVEECAGIWKIKETGKEYVRKIREESEERLKRMGL